MEAISNPMGPLASEALIASWTFRRLPIVGEDDGGAPTGRPDRNQQPPIEDRTTHQK